MTLPLASISEFSDSDFLNLTPGQSYLRSKANKTNLKLDLLHFDSIENKFIYSFILFICQKSQQMQH